MTYDQELSFEPSRVAPDPSWNQFGRFVAVDGTRSVAGAATDDHIVQVRVRPTAFNGADRWVGLMARS